MILNLPYASLRAFEAVVRLGGFSAAANELGVSQSAVSQHVKSLEEWLGQELLVRGARTSKATRYGALLAREIDRGLGGISEVCTQIRTASHVDTTVVISCLPGFAFTWLFPRLLRFDLAHPDLSISIATDTGGRPFNPADADIGIRYGHGEFANLRVDHLMSERLFPVCAPSVAVTLTDVASLGSHTLLQDEILNFGSANPSWEYWAEACGVLLPSRARTRRFGQSNLVLQAAIEGLGVALGREPLVLDALADGRLVRPFAQITRSPLSYWLVRREQTDDSPKVQEFLKWIKEEAESQPDIPDPLNKCA
ncbi:LysR family transcriptional regulator [Jannaschia sp. EhC01]|uniref:LysR family transcriptional regulator n=1 Tax=Gymnodinialimonas phycosphaerae TaxID=2841589 RepID=A0A975TRT6_9RHOB|nr:LysR substrate-binding domain-containing protein [Gymnodinialimonas phycosphaerae]MBY4893823.1 LysR family transcriptional regulator [Gymnodinialimonas phycosphaerae]OAN76600.1 LysR family transcriptional regulator [Jannaschia sp. EhC01]